MRIPIILASVCLLLVGCQQEEGCTDPAATNYDPNAVEDDGSCVFPEEIEGCTDPEAFNYNPDATVDDGSCVQYGPCEPLTYQGKYYDVFETSDDCWFKRNLEARFFNDGTLIPVIEEPETWAAQEGPAMGFYNGDSTSYAAEYGALYNAYVVLGTKQVCPVGWHISGTETPHSDWGTLFGDLGGNPNDPETMKAIKSTTGWYYNGQYGNGNNTSGANFKPAGWRSQGGYDSWAEGHAVHWKWGSNMVNPGAMPATIQITWDDDYQLDALSTVGNLRSGRSIRCVRPLD